MADFATPISATTQPDAPFPQINGNTTTTTGHIRRPDLPCSDTRIINVSKKRTYMHTTASRIECLSTKEHIFSVAFRPSFMSSFTATNKKHGSSCQCANILSIVSLLPKI